MIMKDLPVNSSPIEEHLNVLKHWQQDVPDDRLAHLVRDASRAFQKSLQLRLAKHHVPFGHWTFLRILWQNDGLTQRELSVRAGVMEPTTFSAIKSMLELGYIDKRMSKGNKKNRYIFLTPKGRALKSKLVPLAEETNRVSVKGLSEAEVLGARKVLLTLLHNLVLDQSVHLNPES
jgi:DNA-binding MarR family transcriptional regulator